MADETTQSNVVDHAEQIKQGEVFRLACMSAYLAASVNPFLEMKTHEQRDAQCVAQTYMNKYPNASDTQLANSFIEILHNGAEFNDHIAASYLQSTVNSVNGHPTDGKDLGAAIAIMIDQYAYEVNRGRMEEDRDTGMQHRIESMFSGVVAVLKDTNSTNALQEMPHDRMQYNRSYSNNESEIGPIDNSFRVAPPGSIAAGGHRLPGTMR